MTDKKSNDSRRKLLKSIAAGSGAVVAGKSMPESWSKPVIDSVMLPAHAETTSGVVNYFSAAAPRTRFGEEAGEPVGPMWICASSDGENVTVTFQGKGNNSRNRVVIPINGTGNSEILGNTFDCSTCRFDATINSISDDNIDISMVSTEQEDCIPGYGWRAAVIPAAECGSPAALDGDCNSQN